MPATRRIAGVAGDVKQRAVDPVHRLRRPPPASAHGRRDRAAAACRADWLSIVMLNAAVFLPLPTVGSSASGARSTSQASARATAVSPPSRMMSCAIGPCATAREPGAIQGGQQRAGVAVAEIGLSARRRRQLRHRRLDHAAGAVAAARRTTPRRTLASLATSTKGLRARRIVAGEMPVRQRSTADGRRSRASPPGRARGQRRARARRPRATCATPARRRRS